MHHHNNHRWRAKIRFQWVLQLLLIGGVLPSLLTLRNMGVLNSTTVTTSTIMNGGGRSDQHTGLRGLWVEEEEKEERPKGNELAAAAAAVAALKVPAQLSLTAAINAKVTIPKVVVTTATAREGTNNNNNNNRAATTTSVSTSTTTTVAAAAVAAAPLSSNNKWHNDKGLVHVVLTRFMQHQPDLLHLGRARLELFRTFCLPTLLQQTNHQFLWIIRVDPNLRSELKKELLQLLQTPQVAQSGLNFLVVGSNARIDNGHFRTIKASNDIHAQTVWYGNHALFRDYFHAAQDHTVLETGLDADDGLALSFVEDLQNQAIRTTAYNAEHRISKWWRVYCVSSSDEWQYYGPYWNSTVGSLRHSADAATRCLTPGLTRISTFHYRRYKDVIGKYEGKNTTYEDLKLDGTGFFVDHFFVKNRLKKCGTRQRHSHCYASIPSSGHVQALRARTPTSAGMKDVEATDAIDSDPGRDLTPSELAHWHRVAKTFGVSLDSVHAARGRLHAQLPLILSDALSGQCTEGHTCKDSAKDLLLQLLNASSTSPVSVASA